jgi:hypothetical protein
MKLWLQAQIWEMDQGIHRHAEFPGQTLVDPGLCRTQVLLDFRCNLGYLYACVTRFSRRKTRFLWD